jgi:hypothetical protein
MISADINQSTINRVLANFSELPAQVIRAKKRAVKRVTAQTASLTRREMAKTNQITQKNLRKKKRVTTPRTTHEHGLVWVGYNDIAMIYAGKINNIKPGGIRFRGQTYPSGFIATMPSGHTGAFERKIDPATGQRMPRKIRELMYPLQNVELLVQSVRLQTGTKLEERFAAELNYELNVRGAQ